ncbi:MAG: hypothetical protein ACOX81_02450 [Candidatus Heteroscillospira sp.]
MKRKVKKSDIVCKLAQLAFSGCNDAVKLLYMEPDELSGLDDLDLRHISELKRSSNGAVEIKFTSRLELMQLLLGLLESESEGAEGFVSALDSAAAMLGAEKSAD